DLLGGRLDVLEVRSGAEVLEIDEQGRRADQESPGDLGGAAQIVDHVHDDALTLEAVEQRSERSRDALRRERDRGRFGRHLYVAQSITTVPANGRPTRSPVPSRVPPRA